MKEIIGKIINNVYLQRVWAYFKEPCPVTMRMLINIEGYHTPSRNELSVISIQTSKKLYCEKVL